MGVSSPLSLSLLLSLSSTLYKLLATIKGKIDELPARPRALHSFVAGRLGAPFRVEGAGEERGATINYSDSELRASTRREAPRRGALPSPRCAHRRRSPFSSAVQGYEKPEYTKKRSRQHEEVKEEEAEEEEVCEGGSARGMNTNLSFH